MNFPSVSSFSIAKGTGGTNPPELYLPLYWWSGYSTSITNAAQPSGPNLTSTAIQRGTSVRSATSSTLHTLNPNWSPKLNYALEVSMCTSSSSSPSGAQLIDITSNTFVAGSLVTTTSTAFTVIRSGAFTLIPGHQYGLMSYDANATGYVTDASLIVFPA